MTRRSRRAKRVVDEIRQLPWRSIVNPYAPIEILDAGQIETIVQAAQASGQIARHLGLPFRSSNTTVSNCVDSQAAFESEMSLWGSIMGHANLVNHAAGWLEGGLTASFEKLIIDAEMLQMMAEYLRPIEVNDDELALDAIAEVEPGGHHFGTSHTLARYETAFYTPMLVNRQNFETWQESGSIDISTRANTIWKQMLRDYEQPALDPAIDDALVEYVEKRKQAIAAAASQRTG